MRGLNPENDKKADSQVIAYYPANVMPPANSEGAHIADRKAGIAIANELENPPSAKARRAQNGRPPGHYIAVATIESNEVTEGLETQAGDTIVAAIGKWQITAEAPGGNKTALLSIHQKGDELMGTLLDKTDGVDEPIKKLTAHGNELKFQAKLPTPMGRLSVKFDGKINDTLLTGVIKTPVGGIPFTGVKL
jgi:hypothetical protein